MIVSSVVVVVVVMVVVPMMVVVVVVVVVVVMVAVPSYESEGEGDEHGPHRHRRAKLAPDCHRASAIWKLAGCEQALGLELHFAAFARGRLNVQAPQALAERGHEGSRAAYGDVARSSLHTHTWDWNPREGWRRGTEKADEDLAKSALSPHTYAACPRLPPLRHRAR